MKKIKKILFPIDLTENASKLLPYVTAFCQKYDSTVYLLHVMQDVRLFYSVYVRAEAPPDSLNLFQKEALKVAQKAMDRVCEEQLKGCPNFKRMLVSGDPVDEILKTIESEGIDLVIMGTHGRKGLEHIIFGSVAENVVKKSAVPVMTVNPYRLK